MKIVQIIIISILLISCNRQTKFVRISENPTIEYLKEGYNISIYISDFDLEKGNELNYQGVDFVYEKKYEKAREKFMESLSVEPNNPVTLNNLGNIEYKEHNFKKAIEYFGKSLISSDSLYVSAGINLGKTYSLIGEKEKSELIFNFFLKKTKIDFLKGICYFQLTRSHLDYGEIKKAKLSLLKAKSILNNYLDFETELNELETEIKLYYD